MRSTEDIFRRFSAAVMVLGEVAATVPALATERGGTVEKIDEEEGIGREGPRPKMSRDGSNSRHDRGFAKLGERRRALQGSSRQLPKDRVANRERKMQSTGDPAPVTRRRRRGPAGRTGRDPVMMDSGALHQLQRCGSAPATAKKMTAPRIGQPLAWIYTGRTRTPMYRPLLH